MRLHFFFLLLFVSQVCISQPTTWTASGIGGGGSLFAPSISPADATNMYIQCDMSEVFHTQDAGLTWEAMPFNTLLSTGGLHSVQFTADPSVLYTVNYVFNDDLKVPVKSTNGGTSWQPLSADPTDGDVWYISADPGSTSRLLISSYEALYFSNDGGATFSLAYDNSSDFHIAGVFWDGNNIYVGTQIGLVISTDGGSTFSLDPNNGIPAGQGFMSFTGAKSGSTTRLMGTLAAQADLYPGVNALDIDIYQSIIRRDYGVGNWVTDVNGIDVDHNLFYISSAHNNTDVFYVGGNDPNSSYPVIYKTTNGGNSWAEVFLTTNNQNIATGYSGYQGDEDWWYGEIVFGLAVAPNDPNTVIYTDFGFAHISQDGGANWRQGYVATTDQNPEGSPTPKGRFYATNGLENTSCWNLHWSNTNANHIFASYTDITGVRSEDGGAKWSFGYSGVSYNTIYQVIEDPSNGTLYAATSSVHDMYQSTYLTDSRIDGGSGAILYSQDGGITWNVLHDFDHPVIWLALDPNNSNRLYASVIHSTQGGIFRTDNANLLASSTWAKTAAPPRTEGHPFNIQVLDDGTVVSSWSGRRTSNFTACSGIFTSTDQGNSWTDVSDPNMYYWTKDISIDPNDASQSTWYVGVFSGWGGPANDKGGLYKTTDRGGTWTKVFDSYRVESCTVDPLDADALYVTTESEGLWYSADGTSATPTFAQQSAYHFMHPLRTVFNPHDPSEVWLTSFGNGLQKGHVERGPLAVNVLSFIGAVNKQYNELKWALPETNTLKSVVLESSEDGRQFKEIITSKVNKSHFIFRDYNAKELEYYRVKIILNSGEYYFSRIISLHRESNAAGLLSVYPSPATDAIWINMSKNPNEINELTIYGENGKQFQKINDQSMLNTGKLKISIADLPAGVYFIQIQKQNGMTLLTKFVKTE